MYSEYKDKNVLIFGGMGMIGSTIAHRMVDIGANVTIVDAMLPLYGGNSFNVCVIKDKIKFIKGDIRNYKIVEEAINGQDYIFSLAAQVSYIDSNIEPHLDLDINCKGILNILEACRKKNIYARILFSGSRMEYGKINYNPVDEKHPLNPISIYGIHKLCGENYHISYNKMYNLKTIGVRIANPYGPRQQMKHSKYGILNWFIMKAIQNEEITIFGEGNQIRDYIYVEDLADALIRLLVCNKAYGEVFNIGSGEGVPFKKMVETIVEIVGSGAVKQKEWPDNFERIETGDYISDISKLKYYTSFEVKTNLQEGIKKTYLYYKKYLKNYIG